jgi:hypothetical protein
MTSSPHEFGRVLAELLISTGYVRRNHNPDWVRFVTALPDVGYETLRKAVAGERPVSEELMRMVSRTLNVEVSVFTEYRLIQARRELDPKQVGWSRAVEALRCWEAARDRIDISDVST